MAERGLLGHQQPPHFIRMMNSGGNEPPVSGRAAVARVASKGHVVLDYVMVAEFERERLGRLLHARAT